MRAAGSEAAAMRGEEGVSAGGVKEAVEAELGGLGRISRKTGGSN